MEMEELSGRTVSVRDVFVLAWLGVRAQTEAQSAPPTADKAEWDTSR